MMTQTMAPAPTRPKHAPTIAHTPQTAKAPQAQPMAPTGARSAPVAQPAPAQSVPATRVDQRVELVRLSDETWRVCDSTAVPGQRGYIVGYLQRCDDEYEMLWMHPRPGVVHRHPDFDEALRAISTRLYMQSR